MQTMHQPQAWSISNRPVTHLSYLTKLSINSYLLSSNSSDAIYLALTDENKPRICMEKMKLIHVHCTIFEH